jgi:hypothetical protein
MKKLKLLGKKGTLQNYIIVLDRSFDNIPDAVTVTETLNNLMQDFGQKSAFTIIDKTDRVRFCEEMKK